MAKADVAICVLGKPYQTALTIASLAKVSGKHLGRVFIQEDPGQPFGEVVSYLFLAFPELDKVQFVPKVDIGRKFLDHGRVRKDEAYRQSIRYQYAWENGDEDFLFVTHNDCVFTSDIIGTMMDQMGDTFVGAGHIGQCWNCPAAYAGRCSGATHEEFNPTYEEAVQIVREFPGPRTPEWSIHKDRPMPFPECRLNEFACLINKKAVREKVMPIGDIVPLGSMNGDTGTTWFRDLRLAGYRFKEVTGGVVHAPFSSTGAGKPATHDVDLYRHQEERAKQFMAENFPKVLERVDRLRSVTRSVMDLPEEVV